MNVQLRKGDLAASRRGWIALGIFEGARKPTGAALAVDRATGGAVSAVLAQSDFGARWLETRIAYPRRARAPRVLLVGLGPRGQMTLHRARQAAGAMARHARELGAGAFATAILGDGVNGLDTGRAARATAEGLMLGHYRFTAYRSDPGPPPLRAVDVVDSDGGAALRAEVARGVRVAAGTCLARDLAHLPGQDLVPEQLAARARDVARDSEARIEVLGVPQLERLGMGALLAVGRGSVHPPRFIVLDRPAATGGRAAPTVVVIGKGITFDTGGISIKPRENMHRMKYDMSGAAAVLGLFAALPAIELPLRVVGLIAAAENMPGGRALKPGDIVRALDGTTIEVTNTDAEGRLVLADALGYARRFAPAAVVDLATLTGAVSIALGHLAAGLFANDEALAAEVSAAAAASGERVWRLPAWEEYLTEMKSDVADLVNSSGTREGGAILAAVFLQHFARGMPWVHLDIASTAWSPVDRPLERRGPTGFGVRLLVEWLSRRASGPTPAS